MKNSRLRLIVMTLILALAVWWFPAAWRWLAIDRCLDLGGRWDYAAERCER